MTQDNPTKKYPVTTAEVAKMLGIGHISDNLPLGSAVKASDLPVADLPVVDSAGADSALGHTEVKSEPAGHFADDLLAKEANQPFLIKAGKAVLPYAAVFTVGLFLYFFFFSSVNFSTIFKVKQFSPATPKDTAVQQLEKQDLTAYRAWISSYYYDVSDAKILDPEFDNSGNGLTNFQKYLLKLNPKSYDTLGLGMADSQALANGIDPATGKPLNDDRKALIAKYIDMEVVSNRLTISNMQNPARVAGAETGIRGNTINPGNYVIPSASANNSVNNNNNTAPVTGSDILTPSTDTEVQVNTNVAGRLEVPSLNINVPIIWTSETKNFDKDLQTGVVHYPGTALPGQIGTTYISGHSSNYIWAKGDYNKIFSKLGDLADNTSFKITVVQKNGRDAVFHYVVTGRKEYSATDQEQFKNSGKSTVALSTCWPVGTTAKRLVVFGVVTQVEK
ncbi:MAG: sortase [Candidatus Doudnabacteria bacterium]|jgi:LPXTG-site transpeptidase (sortase) family protein